MIFLKKNSLKFKTSLNNDKLKELTFKNILSLIQLDFLKSAKKFNIFQPTMRRIIFNLKFKKNEL